MQDPQTEKSSELEPIPKFEQLDDNNNENEEDENDDDSSDGEHEDGITPKIERINKKKIRSPTNPQPSMRRVVGTAEDHQSFKPVQPQPKQSPPKKELSSHSAFHPSARPVSAPSTSASTSQRAKQLFTDFEENFFGEYEKLGDFLPFSTKDVTSLLKKTKRAQLYNVILFSAILIFAILYILVRQGIVAPKKRLAIQKIFVSLEIYWIVHIVISYLKSWDLMKKFEFQTQFSINSQFFKYKVGILLGSFILCFVFIPNFVFRWLINQFTWGLYLIFLVFATNSTIKMTYWLNKQWSKDEDEFFGQAFMFCLGFFLFIFFFVLNIFYFLSMAGRYCVVNLLILVTNMIVGLFAFLLSICMGRANILSGLSIAVMSSILVFPTILSDPLTQSCLMNKTFITVNVILEKSLMFFVGFVVVLYVVLFSKNSRIFSNEYSQIFKFQMKKKPYYSDEDEEFGEESESDSAAEKEEEELKKAHLNIDNSLEHALNQKLTSFNFFLLVVTAFIGITFSELNLGKTSGEKSWIVFFGNYTFQWVTICLLMWFLLGSFLIYGFEEGKKMLFSSEESPKPSPRARRAAGAFQQQAAIQPLAATTGFSNSNYVDNFNSFNNNKLR